MFTDFAVYTEQMSKDQDIAFVLLEEKQSKFKPLIKEHNGTLIKEMGEGEVTHLFFLPANQRHFKVYNSILIIHDFLLN